MDGLSDERRRWSSSEPASDYRLLGMVLAFVLVLNFIDLSATIAWIELGLATEVNPLMDYLLQIHPLAFAFVKIGLVSGAVMILWRHRDHRATHVAAGVACAMYLGTYVIHAYGAVVVTA